MAIPSERLVDWEVGVNLGVQGGVEQYLPGGANERTTEIVIAASPNTGVPVTAAVQAAVDAAITANNGSVVKFPAAGTYIVGGIGTANLFPRNFTIRGATSDKADTVILYDGATSGRLFAFGNGSSWTEPASDNTILSGNTQNSTSVTIGDASPFSVNQLMRISWENQQDNTAIEGGATPVIHTYGLTYVRRQTVLITGIAGNVITFTPGIFWDPDPSLVARVNKSSFYASGIGFENVTIDGNDNDPYSLIELVDSYNCWVYNCDVRKSLNYNISFESSMFHSILNSVVRNRTGVGSNGAGVLANTFTGILMENCVVFDLFPCVEWNAGTSGVFGYNFWDGEANFNHGPHNDFILVEGCIGPSFKQDGYFGSAENLTVFRNWVTGVTYAGSQVVPSALNRFTRNPSAQGNIFGNTSSVLSTPYSDGNPNIGNSDFDGFANPVDGQFWGDWKGEATLTTRTTATTGTMTLTSPASITTGVFRAFVQWSTGLEELFDVVASTPQVFTFTVLGTLPTAGTVMSYFAGPSGYQEKDEGVQDSAYRIQNRFINNSFNGIISGEESGETIPDSLYRDSAPDFMSGYTWPPISPSNSTPQYDGVIPASDLFLQDYGNQTAPSITTPCTVTGSPVEGQVLTAVPGTVTGEPPPTRTWKWQRDGADIIGATAISYLLTEDDVGFDVGPVQIEANGNGSDESIATPLTISAFEGDQLVVTQVANASPVTELWLRGALTNGVSGPLEYYLVQHSGPYPTQPDNNYIYARFGTPQDNAYVFQGTISEAEAIASVP